MADIDPSTLSKDAQTVLDLVEKMPALELANLVKVLEDKFGVSAAAPMMMAAAPAAGGAASADAGAEKDSYNVELSSSGGQKIAVIKAIRELTGLGLKEAKDMADGAPAIVKENVGKDEAEKMKKLLEEAGATITLK